MNKQLKAERTIVEAKKYLNIPFRHNGRSTLGLDCIGLIWKTYTRLGFDFPRLDDKSYDPLWWTNKREGERMLNAFINIGGFEIVDKPIIGCLVTFRLYCKNPPINHCGIYVNNDSFIHAKCSKIPRKNKVMIEPIRPYYVKNLFAHYLVHKGISYE
jgi:cell wall-associated NlpC family hydrolase